MRIAVLDDYQKAAHRFADWDALGAEVVFLHDHVSGTAELAGALDGFDVVVAMRERTPFTEERFAALPALRLLVTTGMANASVDLAAARRHGVTVCGTESVAHATAELTWGSSCRWSGTSPRRRPGCGTVSGSTRSAATCTAGRWAWWGWAGWARGSPRSAPPSGCASWRGAPISTRSTPPRAARGRSASVSCSRSPTSSPCTTSSARAVPGWSAPRSWAG